MKYIIKSQRDGWYFTGFKRPSGLACFGQIQDARIYSDKYTAWEDLKRMEPCGQRIIAVTRVGKKKNQLEATNEAKNISF